MMIKNRFRILGILICFFLGWLLSVISFYFTWDHNPDNDFLFMGALIYGIAALPVSFAYFPGLLASILGEQTGQIITVLFSLGYWPLIGYLIYKFMKKGEWQWLVFILIVALVSGYKWHYYAVGMSGI